jgi:ribokinase
MARDIDVLVVGDANPDLILTGDTVPRFGQSEQLLERADLVIGGSGAIVAHGVARLGRHATLAATIGADPFGDLLRERLAAGGVDVGELRTHPNHPTGLTVVLNHEQTRTMLTLVGSISSLDPASIDDALLARTRHLHASSFYLQPRMRPGLAELFARAHALAVSTSLDTNVDPQDRYLGLDDVLPHTDVLLPNRREILGIAGYFGLPTDPAEDAVEAAALVAKLGPLVVVKDGAQGAFAVEGPGATAVHEPGRPVDAVDSTGAGDSFDAAFLAARLDGRPLAECLARACRAGALSTRAVGGTAAQAMAADLD